MALKLGSLFYDIGADTSGLKRAGKEVDRTNKRMTQSFGRVGSAIKTAISFEAARRILVLADNMRLLDARIKGITKTQGEFIKSQKEILAISNRTGQAIATTVSLFESLKIAATDIGATNEEVLSMTESLQQLGIIGGSSVEQMRNALLQFGQAMAGGVLRAEEFNSIIENTPLIARSIAKGLGVSIGQLRKMVIEGKVLSKDVFEALQGQTADIQERFERIPVTMERAWQGFLNNAAQVTKELNDQAGFTDAIAAGLKAAAAELGIISNKMKFLRERETREEAISKILESRSVSDFFNEERKAAGRLNEALRTRERLELEIADLKQSDDEADKRRVVMKGRLLEQAQDTIKSLAGQGGRVKEVLDTWKKMTAEIGKAKDELPEEDVLKPMEAPKKKDKTLSFDAILARLGDERAAVREAFAAARADIISSEKISDDERLELLKVAGARRVEAIKEIAAQEVEAVRVKEEEKAKLQQASDQATLGAIGTFSSAVTDLTVAAGAENSAVAKAAFLAMQGIRVASIIANTQVGAAQALALGPAGIPIAATIESLGFASAGIVAGLAVAKATGAGRQSGGPVSPGGVHPINENGDPEILVQGARQFLLPGSKGGDVISGANMRMGSGGAPSVKIINNGAPIEVISQQISRDEVVLLVKNAENAAVGRVNSSLSSGRGETAGALKQGFETQRNLS